MNSHWDHTVITYINCSAGVKSASDIICTSSNAEKNINSLPDNEKIIFAPDKYLGAFLQKKPGVIHQMEKESPNKIFIPLPTNDGCACNECPHMRLNTIEKMVTALERMEPKIFLSEEVRFQALAPLEKMLALS